MISSKLTKLLFAYRRSHIVSILSAVFSLAYHVSFLIVFGCMKIMPMFYFNFFSVALFLGVTILLFKKRFKIRYFVVCYAEVLAHQILADYFLGAVAGFHFFILLIGFITFMLFEDHYGEALFFGILSTLVFIAMDLFTPFIPGKYEISQSVTGIIRGINLFLCTGVVISLMLAFNFIVNNIESNLENQVSKKTREAKIQSRKLFKLQDHIIFSLASLVENRDTDTGDHIKRTSAYVKLIAESAMKKGLFPETINPDYIELLERAAPMHDIGKIMVPDAVLKKPGKLTPEEFEQMKLHTTEGGRIIREVMGVSDNKPFIKVASEMASGHHERWDGKGYPYQLSGEKIPLSARIMAVADVFDALVSPRCYKEPMPQEKAFKIIEEEAGSHFDPQLVDAFLSVREEAEKVLEQFSR